VKITVSFYKAVEDIHGLMSLSKKVFQPKMMANYYQKLALVFWKSGNFLFHAAAVFKHFQLTREMKKNISGEELARMASRVLAACLCAPLPSQHPEFDRWNFLQCLLSNFSNSSVRFAGHQCFGSVFI
jgi:translation initiation factor 3 subunit A